MTIKNTLLLLYLFYCATPLAAQTSRGNSTYSFNFGFIQDRSERDNPNTVIGDRTETDTRYTASLEIAHFRWKNLQVGLAFDLLIEHEKSLRYNGSGVKITSEEEKFGFGLGPVARYFIPAKNFKIFSQLQVTTGKKENSGIGSTNFVTLRTGAGVDYFLKYNLAIEALVDTSIFSTHSWQGTLFKIGLRSYFNY